MTFNKKLLQRVTSFEDLRFKSEKDFRYKLIVVNYINGINNDNGYFKNMNSFKECFQVLKNIIKIDGNCSNTIYDINYYVIHYNLTHSV